MILRALLQLSRSLRRPFATGLRHLKKPPTAPDGESPVPLRRVLSGLTRTLATAVLATSIIGAVAGAQAIDVSFTPSSGTFTSASQSVTIVFCAYNTTLNLSSTVITLNGTNVKSSFTASSWHCPDGVASEKYVGTITLASGSNTLFASISDNGGGFGSGSASYTLSSVMVAVTPKGTTVNEAARINTTQTFSIQNKRSTSITYNLSTLCSAALNCGVSPTATVAGNSTGNVSVSYTSPPLNGSDAVKIQVQSQSFSADIDTGVVTAHSTSSSTSISFANLNNDDQDLGLCANACFQPVIAHSSLSYRTYGASRGATFAYNAERVAVRPVVSADVSFASGAVAPSEVTLQVKVDGTPRLFVNGDSVLHFATAGLPTTKTYRVAGAVDLSSLATGMYTLELTAIAHYASDTGTERAATSPFSTKIMVVNGSPGLPTKGWSIAGMQRLYRQSDGTVLIVESDGSGVYFACSMTTGTTCAGPSGDFSKLYYDGLDYWRTYPDSSQAVFAASNGYLVYRINRWHRYSTYDYNASGWVAHIQDPYSATPHVGFTYGGDSIYVSLVLPSGGAARPALTVKYDTTTGRVLRFVDVGGGTTSFGYDGSGRITSATDRRGGITRYSYDDKTWRLSSVTLPAVDVDTGGGHTKLDSTTLRYRPWQTLGVPTVSTACVGCGAAPLAMDTAWALVIGAVNDTSRFNADRWGQPLVSKDPLGNTTTVHRTGIFADTVVDALGHTSNYVHTGAFLTSSTPFGQSTTTMQYDAWGQPSQVSSPMSPTITSVYDTTKRTVVRSIGGAFADSTHLDTLGRDSVHVDAGGHKTWYYYDSVTGLQDSVQVFDGVYTGSRVLFDAFGRDSVVRGHGAPTVTKLYDALGRVTAVYANTGAQPTTYTYDSLFVVKVTDPIGQVFKTDHNAVGAVTVAYDPADTINVKTLTFYDIAGRVTRVRNRDTVDVAMTYDVAGRLLSKQGLGANDALRYEYQYSNNGQISVGITKTAAGSIIAIDSVHAGYSGIDTVVTRVAGKRFQRIHTKSVNVAADTTQLSYTDSVGGAVSGVAVHDRIFNKDTTTNMLKSVVLAGNTVRFGYDGELLEDTVAYPSWTMSRNRNARDEVTQIGSTNTLADSAFGFVYQLDDYGTAGRITRERWRGDSRALDNAKAYRTMTFGYANDSPLNAFTEGRIDSGCDPFTTCPDTIVSTDLTESHSYDGVFNRTSVVANGTTYNATYQAGDRLATWKGVSYAYDAEGNRIKKWVGTDTTFYRWNGLGQLARVKHGSDSTQYDYDAFGNLFRRTSDGTIDRYYLYDGGQIVLQVDGTGSNRVGEYVYIGTDEPIAVWKGVSTSLTYYLTDARENVIGAGDGSSSVVVRHFTPWGEEYAALAISDTLKFGWKGLPWEGGVTGLYYVRQRWYDPASRSFISEDPAGIAGGMNTYAYADNDPVQGWDPSGGWALHWGIRWRHPFRDVLRWAPAVAFSIIWADVSFGAALSALRGAAGGAALQAFGEHVAFNTPFGSAFQRNFGLSSLDFVLARAYGPLQAAGSHNLIQGWVQSKNGAFGALTLGSATMYDRFGMNAPYSELATVGQHEFGHIIQQTLLSATIKVARLGPWAPYLFMGGLGAAGEWGDNGLNGRLGIGCGWEALATFFGSGSWSNETRNASDKCSHPDPVDW